MPNKSGNTFSMKTDPLGRFVFGRIVVNSWHWSFLFFCPRGRQSQMGGGLLVDMSFDVRRYAPLVRYQAVAIMVPVLNQFLIGNSLSDTLFVCDELYRGEARIRLTRCKPSFSRKWTGKSVTWTFKGQKGIRFPSTWKAVLPGIGEGGRKSSAATEG
jgi:hypothetical protein